MSDKTEASGLEEKIAEAEKDAGRPFTRPEVVEIIRSVIDTMEGDSSQISIKLYDELDALAQYIEQARVELAQTRPDEINSKHIPTATDELDAVVGATEEATGEIMDACEHVEGVAEKLTDEGMKTELTDAVTKIYEACSFQDITGQRITKVVSTLKHIEQQVGNILTALGDEIKAHDAAVEDKEEEKPKTDADLLNGPQMPDKAIDQDEIDRLLADFD